MSITIQSELIGMQKASKAVAFTLKEMRNYARAGMTTSGWRERSKERSYQIDGINPGNHSGFLMEKPIIFSNKRRLVLKRRNAGGISKATTWKIDQTSQDVRKIRRENAMLRIECLCFFSVCYV